MTTYTQDHQQRKIRAKVPDRTLAQRMAALNKADEVRIYRAKLKRDLKAGQVSIHDLLLDPPKKIETMKLFDLLLAVPKYGQVKVTKILQLCRISLSKTVGGISPRQRSEIVSKLKR